MNKCHVFERVRVPGQTYLCSYLFFLFLFIHGQLQQWVCSDRQSECTPGLVAIDDEQIKPFDWMLTLKKFIHSLSR